MVIRVLDGIEKQKGDVTFVYFKEQEVGAACSAILFLAYDGYPKAGGNGWEFLELKRGSLLSRGLQYRI